MLVKCIKRIPSARYHAADKIWEVSKNDIVYLQKMGEWARNNHFVSTVYWLHDDEGINTYEPLPLPELSVPHNLLIEPYDYQKQGIAYALEKKRCILGDEQGLGKTIEAIGLLTASNALPALVICPASLKINWQRELKKFGGLSAVILDDKNRAVFPHYWQTKKRDGRALGEVFICNYESLRKFFVTRVKREGRFTMKSIEFSERINMFRSVIIDESHKCKNKGTQQSKFVQGICQGKEYVLCLTGTPVVNNNIDLIQQLTIMGRLDDFGGYAKFMARYCAGLRKASHLKELNYLLRKNCFIRRMKKDVLLQLPEKTRSYLVTDIDNMREYKDAERDIINYLVKYEDADDDKIQRTIRGAIMVKMGLLKQISARGKVKGAIDIIHNTIDGEDGQKLIVFCYLKEVVEALRKEFKGAVSVTGDDNATKKQAAVDKFQNDANCKLIILNYKSGGVGLTLTAASNVLFVEQPWTAADCVQAEDRAHRNGQKNAVNCVYLLGEGTIDEYMYELIQTKKTIADGVTGTDDEVESHKVSESDLIFGAACHLFGKK
jgi:SWI/SNF-related matrix-associated actin-dependent regulator 1 of chromatin subfamily A